MLTLDGSVTPYLPTKEILDTLSSNSFVEHDTPTLARMLRERLAIEHQLPPDRIALLPNSNARFCLIAGLCPTAPIVHFPPTESALECVLPGMGRTIISVERSERFRIDIAQIEATPKGALTFVTTPNDPTGDTMGAATTAHLARRSSLLVLDERSAEIRRRSMIPLVQEFDSIVLMRSFNEWAGLGDEAPFYAITSRKLAGQLDSSAGLQRLGLIAALAAVSNASALGSVAQRVRLERIRLYRMLRKLNFLVPMQSDASFVLAHVTRGDRDTVAEGLYAREISVFAPRQPRLQGTLRFSAISPAATRKLQHALVEISRTID